MCIPVYYNDITVCDVESFRAAEYISRDFASAPITFNEYIAFPRENISKAAGFIVHVVSRNMHIAYLSA